MRAKTKGTAARQQQTTNRMGAQSGNMNKIMELLPAFDPNCLPYPTAAAASASCPDGTARSLSRLGTTKQYQMISRLPRHFRQLPHAADVGQNRSLCSLFCPMAWRLPPLLGLLLAKLATPPNRRLDAMSSRAYSRQHNIIAARPLAAMLPQRQKEHAERQNRTSCAAKTSAHTIHMKNIQ